MRIAPIALLVGAAAGLLAATQAISDPDLFWHLATARETLAHGLVRTDLFSWTVRGAPVSIDQWLGQLILYGAYLAGDWRGIAILRIVLVTALIALVVVNAALRAPRALGVVIAALPAFVLTRAVWVDRPELLGLVCFAALLPLLSLARGGSGRALAASVLLVAFWANVHGSFALGAVLVVLVCAEGAWSDRPRRQRYLVAILATAGATLATPAGIGAWTAPGIHFFSPPRDIQEWNVVDVRTPLGAAYAVTLGLVIACTFLGPRVPLRELVVLVPVVFLSLTAARQAPLLAIAAAPMFSRSVALALERLRTQLAPAAETESSTSVREGFGGALSLAIPTLLLIGAFAIAPAHLDESTYPVAALGALPAGDGVLARYEWGGWLIWSAPGTPVFVDGRLIPYRASGVLDDYRRVIAAGPGWEAVVAARGVRALLVVPTDPIAVRVRDLGWRELAHGPLFVLYEVRP